MLDPCQAAGLFLYWFLVGLGFLFVFTGAASPLVERNLCLASTLRLLHANPAGAD